MSDKQVSQLDDNGYFVCPVIADESPLEPGVYLIPAGAIDEAPPKIPAGQTARWDGKKWVFEDVPVEPEPEPEQPESDDGLTPEDKRLAHYRSEADPLFFKAQRGEATMEEWKAKIAEIKARYPDEV